MGSRNHGYFIYKGHHYKCSFFLHSLVFFFSYLYALKPRILQQKPMDIFQAVPKHLAI